MKPTNNNNKPSNNSAATVEQAIIYLRDMVQVDDIIALVDCRDVQVSAVILDNTVRDGGYVEDVPLGDGTFLVISLNLPTKLKRGLNEIEAGNLVGMGS